MEIFTSFMAVGILCAGASLIHDLFNFTPGHITSLFVLIGTILGFFGLYDVLIEKFGYGLSLPITSFGNSLINSAYDGFQNDGPLGILSGMLTRTSAGICGTIIFSFIIAMICKPKD